MATVAALSIAAIVLADCLTGGHLGCRKAMACLLKDRHSRWFAVAGIACAAVLTLLLATGVLSYADLAEQERRFIELCPWCM